MRTVDHPLAQSATHVGVEASLIPAGPLSFAQVVQIASEHHPELRIVQAQAEAARGKMIQSGLYPNPTIGWSAEDMGSNPEARAGRQGPTLGFTLVTGNKLGLAQAAASQALSTADWQVTTRWYETLVRLRTTFYDTHAAQQEVQVAEELVKTAEYGLSAAQKLEKSGVTGRPDVLRAQVELDQFRNRLEVAQRRADTAWAQLTAAMGLTTLPQRPLLGNLKVAVPEYNLADLTAAVQARSAELQAAQAMVMEAQFALSRAQAEVVPNLQVQLYPYYDFADRRAGGEVSLSAPLPLCDRNQGNILAASADLFRAQQAVRQTEVRLTERMNVAYQQYSASRRQAETFEKRLLPNAKESLRLVLLGYEAGDPKYDYTAVLQAQNALMQARLSYVQVLNDLQRAVSEIEGLVQRDVQEFFLK